MSTIIERLMPSKRSNGNGQESLAVSLLTITPAIAEELLKLPSKNRRLDMKMVNDYAGMMTRDRWVDGEANVCTDKNGWLINGHHTLHAVVLSGCTIVVTLKTNMEPEAKDTMDSHRKRTVGDQLKMDGFLRPNVVASTSSTYLMWTAGSMPKRGSGAHKSASGQNVDRLAHLDFCRAKRQLLEENALLAGQRYKKERLLSESQLGALQLYFLDLAPNHASEFFAQMYGESTEAAEQPVAAYRDALRRKNGTPNEWSPALKMIFAFKAFNAFMARSEVRKFVVKAGEKVTVNVPEGVN